MVLYKKREKFNQISIKIGILFSKFGLSPNTWTLLSLLPVIAAAYFIMKQQFLEAAALFAIAAFLDLVDGSVARVTGRATKFGAYLDTIVDRYVEAIILFSMLFLNLPLLKVGEIYFSSSLFVYICLFGSLMTSYAKAAAKEKELVKEEIKGGYFERAERLILLFLGILLAYFKIMYLVWVLFVLAVLTNFTALQRIWIAKKEAHKRK